MVTKLPWQPQCYVNNSFVLSPIEVIFGMKLSEDDRHQIHTSLLWYLGHHGNQSVMLITQFAKSHKKFELVSSSLSNEHNTGLKTRRYIRMISQQSLHVWN